jgi:hypothetical protein
MAFSHALGPNNTMAAKTRNPMIDAPLTDFFRRAGGVGEVGCSGDWSAGFFGAESIVSPFIVIPQRQFQSGQNTAARRIRANRVKPTTTPMNTFHPEQTSG